MRTLIFVLLLPLVALAEDATPEAEDEQAQAPAQETAQEPTKKKPDSNKLRSRELSDAFKNFKPSEEITADNAVAFPIDI